MGDSEDADEDFITPADAPQRKALRMTLAEIEEMAHRYGTRDTRREKLRVLEADLKDNLSKQKQKAAELNEQISQAHVKIAQLASTRQVYHDVESQTRALYNARKELDDFKERDYRLKVNLISLKRAIPRLLSKLTKIQHPIPTDLQLPDAVARLHSEILKYFKEISQSMLKEATPEEMMQISGEDDEKQSQIDKLHGLPGFSKLQRQLYVNMMGARPDVTTNNVRVISKAQATKASTDGGAHSDLQQLHHHKAKAGAAAAFAFASEHAHHAPPAMSAAKRKDEMYGGPGVDSPVIDRDMAKKISALVFQRDGKGVVPAVVKPRKEIKKKFVFRD